MQLSLLAAWAAFAASAAAKSCTNMTITIPASARTGVFDKLNTPISNSDATSFIQLMSRQGINATETVLTGYQTTSGNYNISAKYCTPNTTSSGSYNLQILTHGIGFDKTYWDLPYNNYNYSYVDAALAQGYHTFTFDRLGVGNSSHGDPKNEIQAPLEVAALAMLTSMLRNGSVPGISSKPSKIINVGHSFGSGQTYALTAMMPSVADGIVLTGFSDNMTFVPYFLAGGNFEQAYLNQPLRFGNASAALAVNAFTEQLGLIDLLAPVDLTTLDPLAYPPGYLTNANSGGNQYLFLLPPYFDPNLGYYGERTKQPVAVGELLTMAGVPKMSPFTGPVLVFTGSNDLPFCGGDCSATGGMGASIPAAAKMAFPNASAFEAYLQPNTGHGLVFHYNATAGFDYIQSWLGSHGL